MGFQRRSNHAHHVLHSSIAQAPTGLAMVWSSSATNFYAKLSIDRPSIIRPVHEKESRNYV